MCVHVCMHTSVYMTVYVCMQVYVMYACVCMHVGVHALTKNEITFSPISILFCTKSLLKAQK